MEYKRKYKNSDKEVLVEWTDLGEGIQGDYNPDDPEDIALLRFDISLIDKGETIPIEDASYCTQVPVDTDDKILKEGLEMMMEEIFDAVIHGNSIKKVCERMSWISVKSIKAGQWKTGYVI